MRVGDPPRKLSPYVYNRGNQENARREPDAGTLTLRAKQRKSTMHAYIARVMRKKPCKM